MKTRSLPLSSLFFPWVLSAPSIIERATPFDLLATVSSITANQRSDPIYLDATAQLDLGLADAAGWTGAAFCDSTHAKSYTCGQACEAAPDTEVLFTGGDRDGASAAPYYFIGYSPSRNTVIVAHSGTTNAVQGLVDATFVPVKADSRLGINSTALIHTGFQLSWALSADSILKQVQVASKAHPTALVLFAGHSLGAAIATLDALYLRKVLAADVSVGLITFGMPRVGDLAFANAVDDRLSSGHLHVVNQRDIVPHIPPMALGFRHPSNEVWIDLDARLRLCTTQESFKCSNSLLGAFGGGHVGPYFGTTMDSCAA